MSNGCNSFVPSLKFDPFRGWICRNTMQSTEDLMHALFELTANEIFKIFGLMHRLNDVTLKRIKS